MKYYYYLGKFNVLPIDQDKSLMDIPLVQCAHCLQKRTTAVHISPNDPRKSGSAAFRQAWRRLAANKSDNDLDRWPLYETFAECFRTDFPGLYVSPGVEFGVLEVEVERMVDMATPGTGVMVLRKSLFDWLVKSGLKIEGWPVKARYCKKVEKPEELVELAALPVASAAPGQGIKLCPACNRSDYDGRDPHVVQTHPCIINRGSVPAGVDAFRIIESPGNIIVTERLVEAVADLDCGNIQWAEARVE